MQIPRLLKIHINAPENKVISMEISDGMGVVFFTCNGIEKSVLLIMCKDKYDYLGDIQVLRTS